MITTKTKLIISLVAIAGAMLLPISVQHRIDNTSHNTPSITSFNETDNSSSHFTISRNTASADDTGTALPKPTTNVELAVMMEGFLKVVYILLWPLLWLAGQAMDNSLIYGEFIGIDDALFKFRSIMKNFANFALGFMFLRSVISYVINPTEKKHPKDMIVKLLIAGLGVQISWFAVGALVDLSTVLTTGIGGLPLHFMHQEGDKDSYVFGIKTTLKLNDAIGTNDTTPLAYTLPGSQGDRMYILPCYFTGGKIVWDKAQRGPAFGVIDGNGGGNNLSRATDVTDKYCIRANKPISSDIYTQKCGANNNCPLYIGGDTTSIEILSGSLDSFKGAYCGAGSACQTMENIAKKSAGYQSAFYSLYASLLNLATIHIGVPKSDTSIVMETLIKTIIGLAYLIPLAILCVVLIMRIGYLWLVIAFSPFIALSAVKDLGLSKLKDGLEIGGIKTKFNLSNVISLLLLPVVVTFAISLSIVFLSSLSNGLTERSTAESIGVYSRMEGNYKCYDVAITDICIDMPSKDIGSGIFDYFGWLIMNFFGIGLMWFVVMAALKSAEFTKGVAEKVGGFASSALMNAPIIPVGGSGKRTSLGGVKQLSNDVSQKVDMAGNKNSQVLSDYLAGKTNQILNKDAAGTSVLKKATASLDGKTNDVAAARNAINEVASSGSAFNSSNKLDFKQYDGSTAFANSLAAAAGVAASFSNGNELFTTDKGKEVLAILSKGNDSLMGKLRNVYSGNSDDKTDNDRARIVNDVANIQASKFPPYKISKETLVEVDATGKENVIYNKTTTPDLKTLTTDQIKPIIKHVNSVTQGGLTAAGNTLWTDLLNYTKTVNGKIYTIVEQTNNNVTTLELVEKPVPPAPGASTPPAAPTTPTTRPVAPGSTTTPPPAPGTTPSTATPPAGSPGNPPAGSRPAAPTTPGTR